MRTGDGDWFEIAPHLAEIEQRGGAAFPRSRMWLVAFLGACVLSL